MAYQVSCSDLGIAGCSFSAAGETPGDIVREIVDHVRAQHAIDMPDADVILKGEIQEEEYYEGVDPGARLIVKRLAELLGTRPVDGPDSAAPAVGRAPNQ
jgi:predicted small metal-binding protein